MTDCARGCCWPASSDDDTPEPVAARHGWLCDPCHNRLRRWLTDPTDGLLFAHDWTCANLGGLHGVAYSDDQGHGTPDQAAPINVQRLDIARRIEDHVKGWDDLYRDLFGQQAPNSRFTLASGIMFLANWLDRIEDGDPDPLVAMWDELALDMWDAHLATPWRPASRLVEGVPCATCGRTDLWRRPPRCEGDELLVQCASCLAVMSDAQLARWEEQCAAEVGNPAA